MCGTDAHDRAGCHGYGSLFKPVAGLKKDGVCVLK